MQADLLPRFTVAGVERLTLGPDSVPALLVRPDAPGPHPGAILQHGYASEKAALLPLAHPLAAFGFVVLLVDAWGHGERFPASGPNWQTDMHADYAVEVIRHTVDDMRAGLAALAERPDVRSDRILVGGFSLGAVVSLIAGVEDPRAAAVVSMAGAPLPDLLGAKRFDSRPPSEATRRYAKEHDAAAHVARLAPRPLLISHGRADDLVPAAGALRLYDAAMHLYAGHPDRLALRLYDHRHEVSEPQLRDAVAFIVQCFLGDAISTDAGSSSA